MDAVLTFEEEWLPAEETDANGSIDALLGMGMDERRLHLRAHERWLAARPECGCPTLERLLGGANNEFEPHSLILEFPEGANTPLVRHVGRQLRPAFSSAGESLLARLSKHYTAIADSETPVGFEAELVREGGRSTLYRGIVMPVSTGSGEAIALYGIINSRDLMDNEATITLALEVDRALSETNGFAAEALWTAPSPRASDPNR